MLSIMENKKRINKPLFAKYVYDVDRSGRVTERRRRRSDVCAMSKGFLSQQCEIATPIHFVRLCWARFNFDIR
jgi:hypothetical protein